MSMIQHFLQKHEYNAQYAYRSGGAEVIQKIKEFEPHLVILEAGIGEEGPLCQRIKDDTNANIPVILMAGNISAEKPHEDCGADDVIAKPFEPNLLLKKIENLLG